MATGAQPSRTTYPPFHFFFTPDAVQDRPTGSMRHSMWRPPAADSTQNACHNTAPARMPRLVRGSHRQQAITRAVHAVQVVDKYGADALRLYLVNSPVVRAEPLKFKEEGVFAVVKDVFLPWYNAYRFLCQNVVRVAAEGRPLDPAAVLAGTPATNVLDRWIQAATRDLVTTVRPRAGRPAAAVRRWRSLAMCTGV